jgi:hypothetical protein
MQQLIIGQKSVVTLSIKQEFIRVSSGGDGSGGGSTSTSNNKSSTSTRNYIGDRE